MSNLIREIAVRKITLIMLLAFVQPMLFAPIAQAGGYVAEGLLGAIQGAAQASADQSAREAELDRQKELIRYQYQLEMEREKRAAEQQNRRQAEVQRQQDAEKAKAEQDRRQKEANAVSIGSGFFVTSNGYFVTNYHVVKDAASITLLSTDGKKHEGKIVRVDRVNDLAIIKVDGKFSALPIASSRTARRGQSVATVGYPHADVQGVEPKVTEGIISSLSGISDDPRIFQISVPIQSGNSGGPLVTREGNVIGIVVSKLSASAMLKQTGDVTQNVNYAIKSNYLLELLSSERLDSHLVQTNKKTRNLEDVTNFVEKATALVVASPPKLANVDSNKNSRSDDNKGAKQAPPRSSEPKADPRFAQGIEVEENLKQGQKAFAEQRWPEALSYLGRAAEQGSAKAQSMLGNMYAKGSGVTKDDSEAMRWYRKAAEQGDANSQLIVGLRYAMGIGVSRDDMEALNWYRKSAAQGNAQAQYHLGGMYDSGRGVTKDDAEAARWYRKAAEQGNAKAQASLGGMFLIGRGVPKDDVEAVNWFRKAADQGDAGGQGGLGHMYSTARGVPKDEAEAASWFRKSAEQGNVQSQAILGYIYMTGRGVPKNEAEAVLWYRKAAEQGDAKAQANLGAMYDQGKGIPKDETEAVRWTRKAAEQGNPVGQFNLGEAYEKGNGVPKDDAEAVRWYRKAADQGYKNAKAALEARGLTN